MQIAVLGPREVSTAAGRRGRVRGAGRVPGRGGRPGAGPAPGGAQRPPSLRPGPGRRPAGGGGRLRPGKAVGVLGPLEVSTDDGRPVRVSGAEERLLLAVLVAGAP